MEESHPAIQQPDDGGSSVGSQVAGQATLISQVHDADPNTWCNGDDRVCYKTLHSTRAIYREQRNPGFMTERSNLTIQNYWVLVLIFLGNCNKHLHSNDQLKKRLYSKIFIFPRSLTGCQEARQQTYPVAPAPAPPPSTPAQCGCKQSTTQRSLWWGTASCGCLEGCRWETAHGEAGTCCLQSP